MIRLLALLAIAGLVSCSPKQSEREVYSILYDTTDPLLVTPKVDEMWGYVDGDEGSKSLLIRYSTLSDVDINVTEQLERPASQSGLFSNAVGEKKRLETYRDEFYALFNDRDSIGEAHSSIFRPIIAELGYLGSLPDCKEKQLIVYSNLMENSDIASFYTNRDLWLLEHQPEKIIEQYLEVVPKDIILEGVSLTVIFVPKDPAENRHYQKLRYVYQTVFGQLDVSISFFANLTKAPTER